MTLGLDIFHIINVEYREIRSCIYIARGAPCVVHSLLQPPKGALRLLQNNW